MIFTVLGLVKPTWYFNLQPRIDHQYFPFPETLGVPLDDRYESEDARRRDGAWQIFHSGYIAPAREIHQQVDGDSWRSATVPVADEYRFLVKYYHPAWSIFVYGMRVLAGFGIAQEWRAWRKARKTMTRQPNFTPWRYETYQQFQSQLVATQPYVSIVIPTLNRYEYLRDVLRDLGRQTYRHFEVIVVDQSSPYQSEFYADRPLQLRVWHQPERALWRARNEAIRQAQGDYVLLYDDDSRIEPDWIEQHLKALDFFQADISSGVSLSQVGDKIPAHYSYFRWSDQLDTGNAMIRREVFQRIGLFDRQFEGQRMGDGEFGLRAYLAGFRNVSNPMARRIHLKVAGGGLREMGSWDAWRPKSWLDPRPVPSVLYLIRKYFGDRTARVYLISTAPQAILPYRWKGRVKFLPLVLPLVVFFMPVLFWQALRSWRLASRKLIQGHMIEKLT